MSNLSVFLCNPKYVNLCHLEMQDIVLYINALVGLMEKALLLKDLNGCLLSMVSKESIIYFDQFLLYLLYNAMS